MAPCDGKPVQTGPKGGRFCFDAKGKKHYVRKGTPIAKQKALPQKKPARKPSLVFVAAAKPPKVAAAAAAVAKPMQIVGHVAKPKKAPVVAQKSYLMSTVLNNMNAPGHAKLSGSDFGELPPILRFPKVRSIPDEDFDVLFRSQCFIYEPYLYNLIDILKAENAKNMCATFEYPLTFHPRENQAPFVEHIFVKEFIVRDCQDCTARMFIIPLSIRWAGFKFGHSNMILVDKKERTVQHVEPRGDELPLPDELDWWKHFGNEKESAYQAMNKYVKENVPSDMRTFKYMYVLAVRFWVETLVAKPLGYTLVTEYACPLQKKHQAMVKALNISNQAKNTILGGGLCQVWTTINMTLAIRDQHQSFADKQKRVMDWLKANDSNVSFVSLAFVKGVLQAIDQERYEYMLKLARENGILNVDNIH